MKEMKDSLIRGTGLRLGEKALETIRGAQEILKILVESKASGRAVGIRSPVTGEGFLITAVDDIILLEGETVILLKPYDSTGFMLPCNKLTLTQIVAACPLKSKFGNPVLKNLIREKNWFF